MVKLKSRTQACPNGYLYTQKQTGWVSHLVDPITQWDFNRLCQSIRQHRLSNPQFKLSTDLGAIQEEVDTLNAARVAAIPGGDIYVTNTGDVGASFPQPPHSSSLQALVVAAKAVSAGVKTILDFEDSGESPASHDLAVKRAAVCVDCPQNGKGGFERWFTLPASERIRKQIERKSEIGLSTPSDDNLGVCESCKCPLKLKVHFPIEFILKHMAADVKAKLDPRCWILSEEKV